MRFELTVGLTPSLVFKTSSINHSDKPPYFGQFSIFLEKPLELPHIRKRCNSKSVRAARTFRFGGSNKQSGFQDQLHKLFGQLSSCGKTISFSPENVKFGLGPYMKSTLCCHKRALTVHNIIQKEKPKWGFGWLILKKRRKYHSVSEIFADVKIKVISDYERTRGVNPFVFQCNSTA